MSPIVKPVSDLFDKVDAIDQKRFFFVAGYPKSGTTWVERMLDTHLQIACKGEAHFGSLLEPVIRQCTAVYNAKIPKKGNWSRLNSELPNEFCTTVNSFMEADQFFLLGESIKLMFSKWVDDERVLLLGDKSPNNLEFYPLLDRLFPHAKYIYVVRDVRDVIISGWFFNLNINSRDTLEQFPSIEDYAGFVATSWLQKVTKSLSIQRALDDRFLTVRYETLLHRPEKHLENIFDFLQVDSSCKQVSDVIEKNQFDRLSKGRQRGEENRLSFYRMGIAGDWKNHLSPELSDMIWFKCGALLDQLGYQQSKPLDQ